jgi:hypothetical protein
MFATSYEPEGEDYHDEQDVQRDEGHDWRVQDRPSQLFSYHLVVLL